jgi:hypothetical protein
MCHRAFVADLGLALEGVIECWSSKVLTFLTNLGETPPRDLQGHDLIAHYATLQLPVGSIYPRRIC